MAKSETAYGGLVNPRSVPGFLLGLAIFLVLISFAMGWYSLDAKLRRWTYDGENPPYYQGVPQVGSRIDMEMKMLSIDTAVFPIALQNQVDSRGEPNYDDHAGRMGTIMLGMLFMQVAILVAFAATTAFYFLHRRRRADFSGVTKRLFIVLYVLTTLSLLYFTLRIGPAAEADAEVIMDNYKFNDQVAYQPIDPTLGFWQEWKSLPTPVTLTGQNREVWVFEIVSRPSAGWWMTVAAFGCAIGARVMAGRNGDFETEAVAAPNPVLGETVVS